MSKNDSKDFNMCLIGYNPAVWSMYQMTDSMWCKAAPEAKSQPEVCSHLTTMASKSLQKSIYEACDQLWAALSILIIILQLFRLWDRSGPGSWIWDPY